MPTTNQTLRLPPLAELELADFKVASAGTALNDIRDTAARVGEVDWTTRFDEAREDARREGRELSFDEWTAAQPKTEVDDELALRLLAYATAWRKNANTIAEDAARICEIAEMLYWEASRDTEEGKRLIEAWHSGELEGKS